jgi:hypothetical protein
VVKLRPAVLADLARHGIEVGGKDTPERLRERLSDRYLEDVRRLRERHLAGEIARPDYAGHVQVLKEGYALLGLPLHLWTE